MCSFAWATFEGSFRQRIVIFECISIQYWVLRALKCFWERDVSLGLSLQPLVFTVHNPCDSLPCWYKKAAASRRSLLCSFEGIYLRQKSSCCAGENANIFSNADKAVALLTARLGSKARASPLLFVIWDQLFPFLSQDGWDFLSFVWVIDPGIQTKRKTLPTRKCHGIYIVELRDSSSAWKNNAYLSLILCLWI